MLVPELIEELKKLPENKHIFCQVVDSKGQAWNCDFDFKDLQNPNFVLLRISHPELIDLYDVKK